MTTKAEVGRMLLEACQGMHGDVAQVLAGELVNQLVNAPRDDAKRYQWLRHGDNDELVMASYADGSGKYLPRNERLDAAIDAQMEIDASRTQIRSGYRFVRDSASWTVTAPDGQKRRWFEKTTAHDDSGFMFPLLEALAPR